MLSSKKKGDAFPNIAREISQPDFFWRFHGHRLAHLSLVSRILSLQIKCRRSINWTPGRFKEEWQLSPSSLGSCLGVSKTSKTHDIYDVDWHKFHWACGFTTFIFTHFDPLRPKLSLPIQLTQLNAKSCNTLFGNSKTGSGGAVKNKFPCGKFLGCFTLPPYTMNSINNSKRIDIWLRAFFEATAEV